MDNTNPLFWSFFGFIVTFVYQYLEDKRLKVVRTTYWNKLKFPLLICLIIYFILSFYCMKSIETLSEDTIYEIYTELPNF